jgi:hypothetical protein
VDDTALGDLVDNGVQLRKLSFGFRLAGQSPEFLDFVTHVLGVVTVVQASLLSLTNSLDCIFVVCHISYSFMLFVLFILGCKITTFLRNANPLFEFFSIKNV